MAELREISTRATITPTRFQNVYHWGDLRGDPQVMEQFFDAFVYVANWRTQQFMLRLPRSLLAPETVKRYTSGEYTQVHTTRDHTILEFVSEDDDGAGWVDDEEAEGWIRYTPALPAQASLRPSHLCEPAVCPPRGTRAPTVHRRGGHSDRAEARCLGRHQ